MREVFEHLDVGAAAGGHGIQGKVALPQNLLLSFILDEAVAAHVGRVVSFF